MHFRRPPLSALGSALAGSIASLLVASASLALPHEALEARIAALTDAIEEGGANPRRLFVRAEHLRLHGDFEAAYADLLEVRRLDGSYPGLGAATAQVLFDGGRADLAAERLDAVLEDDPADRRARRLAARCARKLGRRDEALYHYDRLLANERPAPDEFLERAALLLQGASPADEARAVRGLVEGVERLGEGPVLLGALAELELARGNHYSALAALDRAAAHSSRQEEWALRRAVVLRAAGQEAAARAALHEAQAALALLSPKHRRTPATLALASRIQSALASESSASAATLFEPRILPTDRCPPTSASSPGTPTRPSR